MSDTRNHHYVPQGYLRGFAQYPPAYPKRAKVFVTDLSQGKTFTPQVRTVAAIRDFNRIEADDQHPNALEEAYGHLESSAVSAIRRIAKSATFEGEDRIIVLNLMALMATRNPKLRKIWSEFEDRVYRGIARMTVSKPEIWESIARRSQAAKPADERREIKVEDYARVKEFVESDEYDINTHQNTHIALEMKTFDTVLETLAARKWVLQIAADKAGDYVTSDHPVVLRNTINMPGPYGRAAGHGMKNTMLLFPLTRRAALVGLFGGQEGVVDAPGSLVARMNSMVIDNAESQVYAYDDKFMYAKPGSFHRGSELWADPDALRTIDDEDDD